MKNSTKVSIRLNHVEKDFTIAFQKPTLSELFLRTAKKTETCNIIRGISLEIKQGERVAIIGNNGSGKTTILKLISGITSPTSGTISIIGRVVSLIALDSGFQPELTGYENILLNGVILGMTKIEVQSKTKKIISFAGIGEYIHAPFYTYSTGMQLRLAFSIGVHTNPDILVLDEMLSVGDVSFREKSAKKIHDFFLQNKTVIVVSHDLVMLRKLTDRCIWLEKGRVRMDGRTNEVINTYENFSANK